MPKQIPGIAPSSIENVSRRGVLKGLLWTGGFVLAVSVLVGRKTLAGAPKWGAAGMPHGTVNNPLAFVSITPDGAVAIVCHRSEMGQGVRTGMPLIVADELEADWARVKVVQATGDETKYGNQDTDGSRSTRHFILPMRQVGAAARMMLEEAAAKRWGVPVSDVEATNSRGRPEIDRKNARLWRARRRRRQDGRPGDREPASQGSFAVPIHRQGRDQYRRRLRHHDRSRNIRSGCPPAGHEVRRHRATAGDGRQSRVL